MCVDRDALLFNDKVSISERVYMEVDSECDSNYELLNQGDGCR